MNKKTNGTQQSLGGLKEIREIIFGEALSTIQKQVDVLKAENKELKQNVKRHENEIKKSANLIVELNEGLKSCNSNHLKLEKIVKSIEADLKALNLAKIDKNQIGQAFIEWGMKVKEDPTT